MKLGICKICNGDIVEDNAPFSRVFYCKNCGIAYARIPKEMCTKDGLRIIYNIDEE